VTAPVIDLREVSLRLGEGPSSVQVLKNVSLAVEHGQSTAIVGPSGSGKSTLMNVLGCLDTLTSGSYRIAGDDVDDMDETDLASVRNEQIGFVFQQFNLLPSLSALRNVELPLVYRGVVPAERRARATQALERVGLGDRTANRPGQLSGGQQQRVAVARALVGEPALVLADEPTGNLDSRSTADVLDLFDALHAHGRTIVLITHEHEVAERSRRVVRVLDGLITSDAPSGRAVTP